jgi:hypothetical protein
MRSLGLCFFLAFACAHATAQSTLEHQAEQAHLQQLQHEFQAGQARLQQLQREFEAAQLQSQTENKQARPELLRRQMEQQNAEPGHQALEPSFIDQMDAYRDRQAAAKDAKKAADLEAAIREDEVAMAAARSADAIYLALAVALPIASAFLITRRARTAGGMMKYEEKFGVMLMIGSLLLGLLALSISDDCVPRLDAMQNLMLSLKIRLLPNSESVGFMVDVYTKHVLLALVATAAYGFTTYLGITPAWKRAEAPVVAPESHKEA